MSISADNIIRLVDLEMSSLKDTRVSEFIRRYLVRPGEVLRDWDYGEADTRFPCWSVLNDEDSGTGIVYCEFGFGPEAPWGLVRLNGDRDQMSIGMDSGWFPSFLEAFYESFAATRLKIWRVFKIPEGEAHGIAVSEESDWDEVWKILHTFRAEDKSSRYECRHNFQEPETSDDSNDIPGGDG